MAMTLSDPPVPADWARHTPTSDPGPWSALLDAVAPRPAEIGRVVRNLGAHYRGQEADLPPATRGDVDLRWVADMLATDQRRHDGRPLGAERPVGERLQGCCRDHSLLAVAILRHHGVPARCRVGFADYFVPGWHADHVLAEWHDGTRWRRFDPEVDPAWGLLPDPLDLDTEVVLHGGPGFVTAGETFRLVREGRLDPSAHGVAPGIPELAGEGFVLAELLWELAHRYGDELLLWDSWGGVPGPGEAMDPALLDVLDRAAALLAAADAGSEQAEAELHALYVSDARLHPGHEVVRHSPVTDDAVTVRLR